MSNLLRERKLAKGLLAGGAGMMIGEGVSCWMDGRSYSGLWAGASLILLGIFGLIRTRQPDENDSAVATETKGEQRT